MLPSWRKLKDGLLAGIPNRVHSNEESKSRGYRHYMLGDPLRTLILVKDEHDKKILLESANKKWNDPIYLEDIMNFALYEKYLEEAITIGKRLLQLAPDNEDILKNTFSCLLHLKRLEEAEKMIQKRIEAREPSSFEELVISSIHKERGRIEEALYHIGRSVNKNPNNLDALRTWIRIVSSESGKAQALSEMDYLATQYPSAWGPPCALGEWLFSEGDLEQAESYMKSAMEREASEEVIGFMSALYGSDGRFKELIELVENAKKKGEIGVAALMNLTQAYMSLGSWRKAKNSLDLAVKKAPLEYQPALFDMRMFLDEKGIR
jgi:tetratricopeptide (TPR) repeat protein